MKTLIDEQQEIEDFHSLENYENYSILADCLKPIN